MPGPHDAHVSPPPSSMCQERVERWTWHGVAVSLAVLSSRPMVLGAALWRDPDSAQPWHTSLHSARGKDPVTAMFDLDQARWTSATYPEPRAPLDALLAHMALLML